MNECPDFDPSTLELSDSQDRERWRQLGAPAHYAMVEDARLRQLMFTGWLRETGKRRLPPARTAPRRDTTDPPYDPMESRYP
jgi:hypothetical protein